MIYLMPETPRILIPGESTLPLNITGTLVKFKHDRITIPEWGI